MRDLRTSRRRLLAVGCAAVTCVGVLACGPVLAQAASAHKTGAAQILYRFGAFGSKGKVAATERRRPVAVTGVRGRIVQIATSNSDTYALTATGAVYAVGLGADGQLGNGTTPRVSDAAVRVDLPAGVSITALANPMPFDAGLAVDQDGRAWSWGRDESGDLCTTGTTQTRPVRLSLTDVHLAVGARQHSLFYAGHTVYACGSGGGGALGTGSLRDSSHPVAVRGLPAGTVTALTASWQGSGALLSDGRYYDWGFNATGQLGNGTEGLKAYSTTPVRVDLPAPVRSVSQGGSYATNGQTVVILRSGSVYIWGSNFRAQLGDNGNADADRPVRVDVPAGVRFVQVNSGGSSCYAIDSHGRLWDWGDNIDGQLGIGGTSTGQFVPSRVDLPGHPHTVRVSATARNAAVLVRTRAGHA